MRILGYKDIDRAEWSGLVASSATSTWFQSPEAYDFYASQPELFRPFAIGICNLKFETINAQSTLRAVCVGYVTVEKSSLKQFLTRRAIIIGGPCLADDCTDEEVNALMNAVKNLPSFQGEELCSIEGPVDVHRLKNGVGFQPIYIESRNFNDYSRWKEAFAKAGFSYVPHLNFHVDTSSVEVVEANLGKSRKRDIRTSLRDGATIIEKPTLEQVREYYAILEHLYKTRVKTPLFPFSFFEKLWQHQDGQFILVALNNEIIGGTVCVVFNRDKFETINHKFEIIVPQGKETTTHPSVVYEWFVSGRDGEWKSIFPSSLATYAGIKYAAEHGCARFDMMGAGKPDEAYGVRDFKARFGGKEVEHGRFLCITKPVLYRIGKIGVWLLKKLK